MPKPLVAILDTCVLYPAITRDTLLLAAEAGAYQLRWTDEILSELRRNLVNDRAAPEERVEKMLSDFARFFDDGRVSGHERHLSSLRNHPKDRHVVAAAIESGAELIVTANLKDFAPGVMPDGIRAIPVDELLLELLERSPAMMVDVVWLQATRKKRPPMSVEQVLATIGRSAPEFAAAIRPLLSIRTTEQLMAIGERLERALAPALQKPGTSDPEELDAALGDTCIVSAGFAEQLAKATRPLVPMAVRVFAERLTSTNAEKRVAAAHELRARGIDPDQVDVAKLTDDEILALLDRTQSTAQ